MSFRTISVLATFYKGVKEFYMFSKFKGLLQYTSIQFLMAIFAGLLLPFAFAPIEFYPLAIVAPAILLALWLKSRSAKQAFWLGFIFGLSFFGLGVSWVYISIHEFGNTAAPLAALITALFIGILALYPAIQGYLLARFFPATTLSKLYLAFPASWALLEWLRGWLGTGFPWLFLGASQTNSLLKGFAPIVGEFGISFLVALCSALLVSIFIYDRRHCYKSILAIILIGLMGGLLAQIHWTRAQGLPFTATLVQGNIPQQLKWTPDFLKPTLEHYVKLSVPYWNSSLIVWPESAVPALLQDVPEFITDLRTQAAEHYTTFLIGIPAVEGFKYYNGMLLLHDNKQQIYYKRHLVPFGEYLPFDHWLRGLIGFFNIPMSDFSAGPWRQKPLQFNNVVLAPFICYEIAYQQEVLEQFLIC